MGRAIKAVICSLDNLPLLKEQARVLRDDPLIDQIVVVSNGSKDGTNEWLAEQPDLKAVIKENNGAGPGRNAGLDAAGDADYYLMLDGGIRPLIGGTERMLEFLERRDDVDVLGVEIPHFESDVQKAWRRWSNPIEDTHTYRNTRLSHTAYCLARARAFDGMRFCEEGPFGEPGWGVDDDEMAYQWLEAGIVVHSVTNIHPFRRGSGSFRRLFQETGIWPNQYGSVYEKRLVWLQQNWPQYQPGAQWGEPWLTVVILALGVEHTAKLIKRAHDRLRERRFAKPYDNAWNPYHIIAWCPPSNKEFLEWAEPRRLRQHHGDTIIENGQIVGRNNGNQALWAGDFQVYTGQEFRDGLRPTCHYYGLVKDEVGLDRLLSRYDEEWPRQDKNVAPDVRFKELLIV